MSHFEEAPAFLPENFSGRVRLFPLPNLVLFPHVIQPLHVFEPRYVDLLHAAIEGDRLIAMALLESGWESDYEGRPPIAPVACLGRVITWQSQPKGRYNVLLMGLRRVRVVRELPAERTFREAEVEILDDVYSAAASSRRAEVHRDLVAAFEQMLPRIQDADELFNQLSVNSISLGTLTDVIGYALDWGVPAKQMLLAEPDVDRRATLILSHLQGNAWPACDLGVASGFPPAFSKN